jgi:hypothetical protein
MSIRASQIIWLSLRIVGYFEPRSYCHQFGFLNLQGFVYLRDVPVG